MTAQYFHGKRSGFIFIDLVVYFLAMTVNNDILQAQADILNTEVVRPVIVETTALGAAYVAGLAVGFWGSIDDIKSQWKENKRFVPQKSFVNEFKKWKRAVRRTMFWEGDEDPIMDISMI